MEHEAFYSLCDVCGCSECCGCFGAEEPDSSPETDPEYWDTPTPEQMLARRFDRRYVTTYWDLKRKDVPRACPPADDFSDDIPF